MPLGIVMNIIDLPATWTGKYSMTITSILTMSWFICDANYCHGEPANDELFTTGSRDTTEL